MAGLLIPRVFHAFWDDAVREEPAAYAAYRQGWLELNPGWELRFWTPETAPPMPDLHEHFVNGHVYCMDGWAEKWRSNVLRYELLWQFGGVWIDGDMEALRPLEPVLDGVECFVGRDVPSQVQCSIMGAVPGHPFIGRLIAATRRLHPWKGRAIYGTWQVNKSLSEDPSGVTVFDEEVFYPGVRGTAADATERTVGVHHEPAYVDAWTAASRDE